MVFHALTSFNLPWLGPHLLAKFKLGWLREHTWGSPFAFGSVTENLGPSLI